MNTIQKMVFRPDFSIPARDKSQAVLVTPDQPGESRPLALRDAIRIKSAEFWLALGWAELASRELEGVSSDADRHPWTMRVQMLVWSALMLE